MTGQGKAAIDILLAESLKELAKKQPIEKITIKEITDKAGVIRPTFYNHFQDKYELMECIIEKELLEPVYPLIQNGMTVEAMVLLFSNIEKDKAFYTRAVRLEGAVTFSDIAQKCVKGVLLEVIKEKTTGNQTKYKWLTQEMVAAYYAQSMCFVVTEWIKSGMTVPPREMAEVYRYIISSSMEDVIQEM